MATKTVLISLRIDELLNRRIDRMKENSLMTNSEYIRSLILKDVEEHEIIHDLEPLKPLVPRSRTPKKGRRMTYDEILRKRQEQYLNPKNHPYKPT